MTHIPLSLIPKSDPNFIMYITYSTGMETVYIAIFHETIHASKKTEFLNYVKLEQFIANEKIQIIHCGKGDNQMLIFVISTLRETGIQIKQHEYSAITFDENMLEECLKES